MATERGVLTMNSTSTVGSLRLQQVSINLTAVWFALTACVIVSPLYVVMGMGNYLAQEYGYSSFLVTLLVVFFAVPYALAFLFMGPVSDRYGRKPVLVLGIFAFSGSCFALAFAESLAAIFTLRAIQGAFAACFAPVAFAYVAEKVPANKKRFMTAIITSSLLVSITLSQIFGQSVSGWIGWKGIFLTLGVCAALLASLGIIILKRGAGGKGGEPLSKYFLAMLAHLGSYGLLQVYLCAVTLLFGMVAYFVMLELLFLQQEGGAETLFLIRLLCVPFMLSGLMSGYVRERFGADRVVLTVFLICSIMMLAAAMSFNPFWLAIVSVFFVGALSLVAPVLVTLIADRAKKGTGAATSLFTFFMFLGAALGAGLGAISVFSLGKWFILGGLAAVYFGVFNLYLFILRRM